MIRPRIKVALPNKQTNKVRLNHFLTVTRETYR